MKDESLLKIFLILCSLCNCVVGSKVTPTQKADLVKALKEFNVQANLGYVMSIIGNASDMYMLNEADVKIGLVTKYRSSDNLAMTDINLTELHALTYIMFKHATHLNRRLRVVINFFFYRTVLMMAALTYFVISAGLTPFLPFNAYFTMVFMHVMTPLQFFLFGISHKDYGFDQFHRIFGEYRNNQFVNIFSGTQAL
jgi:phospholipid-translocating ATPase